MKRLVKFSKDFLLFFPATLIFYPFSRMFSFLSYFNQLVIWIRNNRNKFLSNDYYSPKRDYSKRYNLYQFVIDHNQLTDKEIMAQAHHVMSNELSQSLQQILKSMTLIKFEHQVARNEKLEKDIQVVVQFIQATSQHSDIDKTF